MAWPSLGVGDFRPNWHTDAIADHLEAVSFGEIRNLMVNIPPRHGKSLILGVLWPAWVWLQSADRGPLSGPQVSFMFASYAESLSMKAGGQCRRLMQSRWYWERWRDRFKLLKDQNTKRQYENDHGGQRFNTSVGGTGTGMGGDVIAIDDAHNVKKVESEPVRQGVIDWWTETVQSRFNDPTIGSFVVLGQRVHESDICGYILEHDAGNWTHLCLPARYESDHPYRWSGDPRVEEGELLWPSHMDEATLDKIGRQMTSYALAGQYQQRPAPRAGGMFQRDWLKQRIAWGEIPEGTVWWRHWDLAATERKALDKKGARTAGVMMGRTPDGRYVIADCIAKAIEGKAVQMLVRDTTIADHAGERFVSVSIAQDPGQAGKVQKTNYVELLEGYDVRVNPERGDKEQRAEPFAAQCEGGKVWLVPGAWNDELIEELCVFPGGKRKDIVDACSGAFTRLVLSRWAEPDGVVSGPRAFVPQKEVIGYEEGY